MAWDIEVCCFDCNTILGYTAGSAPSGIILCEDCKEKEQSDEYESTEVDG